MTAPSGGKPSPSPAPGPRGTVSLGMDNRGGRSGLHPPGGGVVLPRHPGWRGGGVPGLHRPRFNPPLVPRTTSHGGRGRTAMASSAERPFRMMRYAHTTVALRDTPRAQLTSTWPPATGPLPPPPPGKGTGVAIWEGGSLSGHGSEVRATVRRHETPSTPRPVLLLSTRYWCESPCEGWIGF